MSAIKLHDCEHSIVAHTATLCDSAITNCTMERSQFREVSLNGTSYNAVSFADATFENASFAGSAFRNATFENVQLVECQLGGMTIDGIAVTDLLEAYRAAQSS